MKFLLAIGGLVALYLGLVRFGSPTGALVITCAATYVTTLVLVLLHEA